MAPILAELAAAGVVAQTVAVGHPPIMSLALAVTFCAYGLIRKQVTVFGSWYFSINEYDDILRLLQSHSIDLERLATHTFALTEAETAFRKAIAIHEQLDLAWQWPLSGRQGVSASGQSCQGRWYSAGRIQSSPALAA